MRGRDPAGTNGSEFSAERGNRTYAQGLKMLDCALFDDEQGMISVKRGSVSNSEFPEVVPRLT